MNVNVRNCRVVLRPRGALEVVDLTLAWIRREWRPLARVASVLVLPIWGALSVLGWWTEGHLGVLVLGVALAPVIQAPVTVLVAELVFAEDIPLSRVFSGWWSRAWSWLGAWMLFAAGLLLSIPTCGYGLPVVWSVLLFATELAMMERKGLVSGVDRGMRLTSAAMPTVGAGVFIRVVGTLWSIAAFEAAGQALVSTVLQLGMPFGSLWDGVVTPYALMGLLLSHQGFAVYRVLLYLDVRTATEGWDLKVGLMAAAEAR